jgi:hypothetical protein
MPTFPIPVRALKNPLLLVLLLALTASAQAAPEAAVQDTSSIGKVLSTVESFGDFLLKYFIALAAVGALAMAIVELFKKLWEWRTRHYAKALVEWFDGDKAAFCDLLFLTTNLDKARAGEKAAKLVDEGGSLPLIGAAYLDESALFSLELDQMMGHVQDAIDTALNNPDRYPALYAFATRGADEDDIRDWQPIALKPADPGITAVDAKERADIYTRLHQIVKRRLDAFQLMTGRSWVNWNQFWANVAGFLVMGACLVWLDSNGTWKQSWITLLIFSLMGGVLSPVAKDIIIALKKVRGG